MEQPRHNLPVTLLELARRRELPFEDRAKFWDQREHAPLPVLRLARLQPQPAGAEVDMVPLAREEFGLDAPARDVGAHHDGPQLVGEAVEDGLELRPLEEALPHVVLVEHAERRAITAELLARQTIHPLQRGLLTVDRRVRRPLGLTLDHVLPHHLAADLARAVAAEHRSEMSDGVLDPLERAPTGRPA